MKSWADVTGTNLTQSEVFTTKTVKEAVKTVIVFVNEDEEKSEDLIICKKVPQKQVK
jgi:hypothetical protein